MTDANANPQIKWSVWGNNPTVTWTFHGTVFAISFSKPPLSVADLPGHSLIAIVGDCDEFGSKNLLLYSYDGALLKTLAAPELGAQAQFGTVSETPEGVNAVVGFVDETGWVEKAGDLDLKDGTIAQLNRSY